MEKRIIAVLKDMSDSDLIALWNEYCEAHRYYDDHIYYMDEFNELECDIGPRSDETPLEFIERMQSDFKDFDTGADYFVIGIYGYEAFDCLDDKSSPFSYTDLANSILNENVNIRGYDDLEEIMQDTEGEDNEE